MSAPPATIVDLNGLLVELQKVNNHVVDVSERHNYAAEGRNNRNAQFIIDNANRNADYTNASVDRNGAFNWQATEGVKDAVLASAGALGIQTEKVTNELVTLIDATQRDTKNQIHDFSIDTVRDLGQVHRDQANFANINARDFANLQRDQVHFERNLVNKLDNNLTQIQLQAADNKCELKLQAAENKSDLLQYQAAQFAALQMQASSNKSELLQKLSDCCCEIKETITGTDTVRIRDALSTSEIKNIVLQSTCYPACGRGAGGFGGRGRGSGGRRSPH
jgi:hypothetical protein